MKDISKHLRGQKVEKNSGLLREKLLNYICKHTTKDGLEKMIMWAKNVGPKETEYTLPLEITKYAPRVWVDKII